MGEVKGKGCTGVRVYGCTGVRVYGCTGARTGTGDGSDGSDGAHRAVETKHYIKHRTSCKHVELKNN